MLRKQQKQKQQEEDNFDTYINIAINKEELYREIKKKQKLLCTNTDDTSP